MAVIRSYSTRPIRTSSRTHAPSKLIGLRSGLAHTTPAAQESSQQTRARSTTQRNVQLARALARLKGVPAPRKPQQPPPFPGYPVGPPGLFSPGGPQQGRRRPWV